MTDASISAEAKRISEDEFAEKYSHPFLSVKVEVNEGEPEFRTIVNSGSLDYPLGPTSVEESLERVVKRSGANNFSFITIGRAQNNDIVIGIPSVSKCHAVIQTNAEGYTIADAGSKNGTLLNSESLQPHKHVNVSSGDELRLPPRVRARFMDARTAYSWLRKR